VHVEAKHSPPAPRRGITARSVLVGTGLIPLNCWWVTLSEIVWPTVHATVLSLFFNVVFTLFALCLVNLALRRWKPAWAFSSAELLVVYAMLAIATSLYGHDMLQILFPLMNYAHWFATPENDWSSLFHGYLPEWLIVSKVDVIRGYYVGEKSFWDADIVRAWLPPLAIWLGFILVLYFVFLCLNALVRRQWTEHEKLSYPIAQLPLEMIRMEQSHLFRNPLMWWGFALAGSLDLWHGFAELFPVMPDYRFRWEVAPLLTQRPWNGISWLPVRIYPFAMGLAYFMPLDLSFSTWFFYLYWKATEVIRVAIGLRASSGYYLADQSLGAWLGLGLFALWKARYDIRRIFRDGWTGKKAPEEPMSPRTATLGLALGTLAVVGFMWRSGVPLWASFGFFAAYYVIVVSLSRMRAELGPPTHDLYYGGPERLIVATFGTRPVGPSGLAGFSLYYWITRDYRCHPSPHQLEAMKLAEPAGLSRRSLSWALMLAALVGTLSTYFIVLPIMYRFGSAARVTGYSQYLAQEAYARLERWMLHPEGMNADIIQQIAQGFGLTVGLLAMRHRYLWFPFHPVGLAVAGSWTMSWMWFSVLLSWALKLLFLRTGGIGQYRRFAPFFMGLVLGQFLVGSAWSLVGNALGKRVYGFFVG